MVIDDAEYIVRQNWANDAWSFLRALVDDSSIRSLFGLYLSGYRNLHNYQQTVGSPLLNVADIHWLDAFTDAEASVLIKNRYIEEKKEITELDRIKLIEWGGGHPYLTQQLLNISLDNTVFFNDPNRIDKIGNRLVKELDFSNWWDGTKVEYGFTSLEQKAYLILSEGQFTSSDEIASQCDESISSMQHARRYRSCVEIKRG